MLAQAASERGMHTFTGTYLTDNRPVTALINEADEPANQVTSRGIAEFCVPLPPDQGHWGTITRSTVSSARNGEPGPQLQGPRHRGRREPARQAMAVLDDLLLVADNAVLVQEASIIAGMRMTAETSPTLVVAFWPPSAAVRCKLTGVVRSFRTAMPPVRTG